MTTQAPKGGATSRVNGQWYEGGEFMPDHGMFCGKKGAKRTKKVETWQPRGRLVNLGGNQMFEMMEYEGDGIWLAVGCVIANDAKEAREAFDEHCPHIGKKRMRHAWKV